MCKSLILGVWWKWFTRLSKFKIICVWWVWGLRWGDQNLYLGPKPISPIFYPKTQISPLFPSYSSVRRQNVPNHPCGQIDSRKVCETILTEPFYPCETSLPDPFWTLGRLVSQSRWESCEIGLPSPFSVLRELSHKTLFKLGSGD